MDTLRGFAICLTLTSFVVVARGQPSQPATEAAFAEQLRRLDPENDKATRLKAVRWINAHSRDRNASAAISVLQRCCRMDGEGEVRREAVLALCLILKHLEEPCPLVVVEALLDKEDEVRWQAMACTPFFQIFAPGSVEVLLRGVKSDKPEVRSDALLILGRAGRQHKAALEVMEKAKRDKVFLVRHNAHVALFKATDKLEDFVQYLIRLRDDRASVLSPGPEDSEVGKRERTERNLCVLGAMMQMIEWTETRADDLAQVLLKLSAHESPLLRRGAVQYVGACVVKAKLPENFLEEPRTTDPDKKEVPEKSAVCLRLEKLKVKERLRELCDNDPDRSVREMARFALGRLASVSEK